MEIRRMHRSDWCYRIGSYVQDVRMREWMSIDQFCERYEIETSAYEKQVKGAGCLDVEVLERIAADSGHANIESLLRAVLEKYPTDPKRLEELEKEHLKRISSLRS